MKKSPITLTLRKMFSVMLLRANPSIKSLSARYGHLEKRYLSTTLYTTVLFLLELKYRDAKKENKLVYFDHQNVDYLCSSHQYPNSSC